ncbi:MAG: zf-HC2 domain-containing protein [Candidatus Aquicultor sp.]|nr:zf-HC2 domain-containing protein [Candidatus Aquicultor sp.]
MKCSKALRLLPFYYDGILRQERAEEVASHIRACPSCSAEFLKIERLSQALSSLSDVELPRSLAEELESTLRKRNVHRLSTKARRYSIAKRASLLRAALNLGYAALFAALIFAVAQTSTWQNWQAPSASAPSALEKQNSRPPVKLKQPLKEKSAEPGVESLERFKGGIGLSLQPEVGISKEDYAVEDVEDVKFTSVVLSFADRYTAEDAVALRDKMVSSIIDAAGQAGQDAGSTSRALSTALAAVDKPALPAYAERASLQGRDVWLFVLVWSPAGSTGALSSASVVVIDPASNEVVHTE